MSHIEKEKLIKADIASIENRVRHAFNQGYDLGYKEGKANCSEIPTGSTDCISRQAVIDLMMQKWGENFSGDNAMQESIDAIRVMPSVTPQEPQSFKWCTDCKEYDQEKHCCHRWSKVIRDTVEEMKQEPRWIPVSERLPASNQLNSISISKNDLGVDLISREQAKTAIRDKFKDLPSRVEINTILNELPSVTPQEPKKGHWIPTYGNVKCSVCGSVKDSREVGKATHYCDFCGAKMFEPQESEDNK